MASFGKFRFLTLIKPVLHILPEVAPPDRKIPFKARQGLAARSAGPDRENGAAAYRGRRCASRSAYAGLSAPRPAMLAPARQPRRRQALVWPCAASAQRRLTAVACRARRAASSAAA